MSRSKATEATVVEQSEEFRPYSREVQRRYYILNAPIGLLLFLGYCAVWSQENLRGFERLVVWLYALFLLALPVYGVYEWTCKRRVVFSAAGVVIDRLQVIPWHRVVGVKRTQVKPWLVRAGQERLLVQMAPERAIRVTGAWSLLRRVQQALAPKPQEFAHFIHPPEVIDQIVAAMEKYSGKDFH